VGLQRAKRYIVGPQGLLGAYRLKIVKMHLYMHDFCF